VACDIIPADGRIEEMEEIIPQKKVLLLDFTDQMCINCPQAAVIIDSLQKNYGTAVVAVSIHTSKISLPLVTPEGKDYDEKFGINYTHPSAVIDGLGVYIADLWAGEVMKRFNVAQKINLEITSVYNETTKTINIRSEISNAALTEKLKYQLWLIEDSIVDWQLVGAAQYNMQYVHNHVFRANINGFSGENITLTNGSATLNNTFEATNEKWNPQHLSVVGFIYNVSTDEVYDVIQSHLF
jgi:hypothetical protein